MMPIRQHPPSQNLCHVLECFLQLHIISDAEIAITLGCAYKKVEAESKTQHCDDHIEGDFAVMCDSALIFIDL